MRRGILFCLLLMCNVIVAQDFVCGGVYGSDKSIIGSEAFPGNIEYGGVFTPKGDIRILVVFVRFNAPYDTYDVPGWPVDQDFPNWAVDNNNPSFYTSYSQFSSNIYSDTNRYSISNFYYQMSNGVFRLIADYYSEVVKIDVESNDDWEQLNTKTINAIKSNVNWSRYDNRTRHIEYQSDDSGTMPDYNVDYVMICYRFDWDWNSLLPSDLSTRGGGATAFSMLGDSVNVDVGNGYCVKNDGFTLMEGASRPIGVFIHELGHELFCGPHYNGCNKVSGYYFYMPAAGWGMMDLKRNYTCALGWERYVLDWTPQIEANGISSDIDDMGDLVATDGIYTLRDFITTGDAIRIKVPSAQGKYQYLWLENHQGLSTFDGSTSSNNFCGEPIEEYKKGLIAYVEEYSHVKDEDTIRIGIKGNAIRWLTRNGNYDFIFTPTPIYPGVTCSETITYPMYKGSANPIGGQNVNEFIRHDFDVNGIIGFGADWNAPSLVGRKNECSWVVEVDDEEPTARWITGTGMQFHEGDKVGMATNPTIKNMPEYDNDPKIRKMGDYYLNGISFEVLDENAVGSITVKIRLDDVAIDRDVRWAAASMALTDITGDNRPDVDVMPNITLTIDMSETPNRERKPQRSPSQSIPVMNTFVTPTLFSCRSGSYFKQEPYSVVDVKASSSLVVESGAVYEVGDHAVLKVADNSTLHVKRGATLRVHGAGRVEIGDMGYICIEDGAHIHLVDTLSAVTLMPNVTYGVYAGGSAAAGNCTNIDLVQYPLQAGSKGEILKFYNGTKYIQRKIYTKNAYVHGSQIYAGGNVIPLLPSGDVVIKNGAHVIWDAVNDVHLEPGVRVEAGGALEVR